MIVRLCDSLELTVMLLCRMHRSQLGHVEHDDRAVPVCARQHQALPVRGPGMSALILANGRVDETATYQATSVKPA